MTNITDTGWTFPLPADRDQVGVVIAVAKQMGFKTGASMDQALRAAAQLMAAQMIARGLEQVQVGLEKIADNLLTE